jgi:hypothetical protein
MMAGVVSRSVCTLLDLVKYFGIRIPGQVPSTLLFSPLGPVRARADFENFQTRSSKMVHQSRSLLYPVIYEFDPIYILDVSVYGLTPPMNINNSIAYYISKVKGSFLMVS